jgi:hypothetical protein
MKKCYVYGWVNKETSKKYIGYKSPDGEDISTYIASTKSKEFIHDYSHGFLERYILFEGDSTQNNVAKTLEWFALDYADVYKNKNFYNKVNSAHCIDEKLLSLDLKNVVVDFINDKGKGIVPQTIKANIKHYELKNNIEKLADNVLAGKYNHTIQELKTSHILNLVKNQVRVFENAGREKVHEISDRMRENPSSARKIFKPVSITVNSNGDLMVIDGNTRTAAADLVDGWEEIPCVILDADLFGHDEKTRQNGYIMYGAYMNCETEEIRTPNSMDDIKSQWLRIISNENLDINDMFDRETAKELVMCMYENIIKSAKKRAGIWKSLIIDIDKERLSTKYSDKKLAVYTEKQIKDYAHEKYTRNKIAYIYCTFEKFKECGWYIARRMKNLNAAHGAIIIYYNNFKQIEDNEENKLVKDILDTIKYFNLEGKIQLEVLPAFSDKKFN